MFCIYLRTNSDLCHFQPKLIGLNNPDVKCLQRGTDWIFKLIRQLLVFIRLTEEYTSSPAFIKICLEIWIFKNKSNYNKELNNKQLNN